MKLDNEQKHQYLRLVSYVKPYRFLLALAMLGSLCAGGTDVLIAWLVKPFVDELIAANNLELAKWVPALVVIICVFKGIARYIQEYYLNTAGQGTLQDIRNHVFKHSLRLSMRFHSSSSTGGLMSRILNDINVMQAAVADVLVSLVRESVTMMALTGYAFYTNWKLAAVAFVAVPAAVAPAAAIGRKIKKYSRRGQSAMGGVTAILEQAVSGIKVIKAFATEDKEEKRFVDENAKFFFLLKKTFRYAAATTPVMETMTGIGIAAVLWYGLDLVVNDVITKGELFSILAAIGLMYAPMKRLTRVNNKIQRALGAAERVFSIVDTPIEIEDATNSMDLPRSSGRLEFRDVSFAYDSTPVLNNFNLTIAPGQIVAFVGASGAGKSTLISLLNRFYDPQHGSILIDDFDIRNLTSKSLHASLALVDQETFLFDDTIAYNISYGSDALDLVAVKAAASKAYASSFIESMPEGYETCIGDRGVRLSGGQRQRICIARAILKDAPILLLDEATSALDTESEAVVQKALKNLMRDRTTLVIAHRLSTIKHADTIVVMDNGEIVEQGSHDQLLSQSGAYRRLYDAQFSGQES